jgi:hypothetical protein
MGCFGMYSIAKNNTMSCLNASNMSSMYKWIRREGIWNEILSLGGTSFMIRMGKLEDRLANQRRKKLVILNL